MPQKRQSLKISDDNNDALYRAAFMLADTAMFVIDSEGLIVAWSGGAAKVFGYDDTEASGKNVAFLFSDENAAAAMLWKTNKDRRGAFESSCMTKERKTVFVSFSAVPLEDGSGRHVCTVRDITEDRRTMALLQAKERNNDSQVIAQDIFNAQAHGVIITSPQRLIIDINESAARLLGYARAELIGKSMELIAASAFNEQTRMYLMDFLKNHDQAPPAHFEFRTKDNVTLPIEAAISVIREQDGAPKYFINSIRDMTEQKHTEAELRRVDQIKGRFIQVVAHQCRTPMSAIQWHLETLLAEEIGPLNEAQQEFIRVMHDKTSDVIDLIGDLLTSIDIEENRLIIESDKVSIDHLVTGVVNQWRTKCAARGVGYVYHEPSEPLPPVEADAAKIRKVIQKMVENAINYTPKDGTVEVSVSMSHGAIRVEVKDTGIGIPQSEQSGVFTRFFRASNASLLVTDASGLGLYVAKHFVEKHGGRIGFTSDEGKGSTFWFELPIARFY